jgi:hypothetical protein
MIEQNLTNNSQLAIHAVYGRKMIAEKADNNTGYELTSCMTLSNVAKKELMEVLLKEFGGFPTDSSEDLVEDFGMTLLNLAVIAIKRRLKNNKIKNT